jgi:hypothetical protein
LAEDWLPTFNFGRILPKLVLAAKGFGLGTKATSSCMPTAKSEFGCQKKVGSDHCQLSKLAIDLFCLTLATHVVEGNAFQKTHQNKAR